MRFPDMATNTDIPQGYKATALGIIPQEWEAMRLSDVCTLINGRAYKQNELLSKGKYKILRVGNFFTNDSWYFSDMELDPNKYAYKGDLLYAWSASFGPRFWTRDKVIYHYHIWKICNLKGINQQYLYFFLDYDASLLQRDTQGGTMHHITKENMEKRFIPVPPLAEQRKIAEVLGVWDEAIEKQARLIEKLALRKRGLMQRLLSAKLRLPGFSDPWQKVKFCELFTKSIKTADPLTKYEVLSVTKEGIVAQKSYFNKDIASEDTSKYIVVERGDLAMSGLNFWMGSCHILTNFNEGIISPAYKVFKVTEHNNINFIRDFVRSSMFLQALQGCSVIGASIVRRNLDKEMLYEWTFKIPSLKEQTAIAKVLTAADREIELAKEKHERLRHQKRGLMQQLLTGKKRVKY